MKVQNIEGLLIAAAPFRRVSAFSDDVMSRIESGSQPTRVLKTTAKEKHTIWFRLRHLPKLAVIVIALLAILAVSGTAYAIYQLWPKPSVELQPVSKNQFGRNQVIASFENCSNQAKTSTFEIKKGSTLDPSELPKVLQARCEKNEIEKWAKNNKLVSNITDRHATRGTGETKEGDIEEWRQLSWVASKVVSLTPTQMSLTGDSYNTPKAPLTITPETKFIVNGNEAKREDIKPGDAVLFIKWERYQYKLRSDSTSDHPIFLNEMLASKATHVIKVDLPFEYYGPTKQNQIIEREACYGNPEDTCINGGGVDLYENLMNGPEKGKDIVSGKLKIKHLQAVIQSHADNVITVKSSSGRIFTLTLPTDIITAFNSTRSANYNNIKITVGDMLDVTYYERASERSLALGADKITDVNFAIDFIQKDDPIKKY